MRQAPGHRPAGGLPAVTDIMPRPFRRILGLVLVAVLCGLSAACSPDNQTFNNVDVTGAGYAKDFSLSNSAGVRRSLADYRDKIVVVFFGFAQCPDICPATLADLAQVRQRLGADKDRLQVVFITLDPQRDTPAVLAAYVPAFDPTFAALTGTAAEIEQTARDFKIFFQKTPGQTPTSYTIDHTTGSYVYDPQGRLRLFLRHGQGIDSIVSDLKKLLR